MAILLFPTDIEDKEMLNKTAFLNWTKDSKWKLILADEAPWYEGLQDEFEAVCESYWAEMQIEAGYFPGTRIKDAFFAKMQLGLIPSIPGKDDIKARNSAERAMEAAEFAVLEQSRKAAICKSQWAQSEEKLAGLQAKLDTAKARFARLSEVADGASTDF